MIFEIGKLFDFQNSTNIKCLHNEIIIIQQILEHGPLPSLDLMRKTGRSISGHTEDLKRLVDIGALTVEISEFDKRKRIYEISKNIKEKLITK